MSENQLKAPPAKPRLLFIDGLRGLAASAVLLFHVSKGELFKDAPGWVWPINAVASRIGVYGVEIFFVISGFVIAYSLRNQKVTAKFIGQFAVRRSLRLDPPYWAVIAVVLLVSYVFTRFLHANTYPLPSGFTLAANIFYLQGILHRPNLLLVFWTLCYEVQFYLFYIFLLFFAQTFTGQSPATRKLMIAGLVTTAALSCFGFMRDPSLTGWCFKWWYLFALGALLCQEMQNRRAFIAPVAAALVLAVAMYLHRPEAISGAATALALYAAIKLDGLRTWLSDPVMQYLGRISYSLYLTHILVLQVLFSIFARLHGMTVFHCVPAYLLLIAIPLFFAEIFYRAVEKPSHRLAIRWARKIPTAPKQNAAISADSTAN